MPSRRVELNVPPAKAFMLVHAALTSVGSVKGASQTTDTLHGSVRYGLAACSVRISVLSGPSTGTSIVELQAKGQDVWGSGARKAMDKVIGAIQ